MRILHITEAAVGGIATYLSELLLPQLTQYRPEGDVGLLVAAKERGNLSARLREQVSLYTYDRRDRGPASVLALAKASLQVIDEFKPDVIHLHSSYAGLVVRLLPIRVPIVYSPHGWAFDIEFSGFKRKAYQVLERMLAYRARVILNVSDFERRSGLTAGLPAARMRTVRTGISADRLREEARSDRQGPIKLLFVGRFDRQKGLSWFLRVFAQLPKDRFRLLAIGGHVRDEDAKIRSKDNLQVLNWRSSEELDSYYDEADLVVVPSRWETFGLVVVEAMRRGCPVLASNRGALPELMSGADCGANLPLDNDIVWQDWLMGLDRKQLAAWGENAKRHYAENFTATGMLQAIHCIYNEVGA